MVVCRKQFTFTFHYIKISKTSRSFAVSIYNESLLSTEHLLGDGGRETDKQAKCRQQWCWVMKHTYMGQRRMGGLMGGGIGWWRADVGPHRATHLASFISICWRISCRSWSLRTGKMLRSSSSCLLGRFRSFTASSSFLILRGRVPVVVEHKLRSRTAQRFLSCQTGVYQLKLLNWC